MIPIPRHAHLEQLITFYTEYLGHDYSELFNRKEKKEEVRTTKRVTTNIE